MARLRNHSSSSGSAPSIDPRAVLERDWTPDHASVPDDLFGNDYEYLIRNFASKAGKSSGEFYMPKEVAFLMSEIVEPEPTPVDGGR